MPGPFPGMDPYLEEPILWPGFHQFFVTYLSDKINGLLPSRYVAAIEVRTYFDDPARIVPPAHVSRRSSPVDPSRRKPEPATGGACDPPWVIEDRREEIREGFIAIQALGRPKRVVTVIELLSPSNKSAESTGRASYRAKQAEVLGSPAHLIEVDLLRDGEHTVAVSRHQLARRGRYDYLTCLNRADGPRWRSEVWARTIRDRLPRFAVPLLDGDPDLALDLQPLLDRCYDAGAYGRRIDYAAEPVPPLTRADAEWVDDLLREKGRRG